MRELLNRTREQWALIRRADQANTRLAVFVHGFRGNYLSTWGKLPDLLLQHADTQPPFADWDYVFLGYDTRNVSSYLDIAGLLSTHWGKASVGDPPYNRPYTRLALFGHSLGTLGIRQLLCAWSEYPPRMHPAVHSITLFGTPLNGSPWALFGKFFAYKIADALEPASPQLRMLRAWARAAHFAHPWPKVRIVLGQDDRVVGDEYAELITWDGDDQVQRSTLDHGALVKPDSWRASELVDFVAQGLRP